MDKAEIMKRGDVVTITHKEEAKYFLVISEEPFNKATEVIACCLVTKRNDIPNLSVPVNILGGKMFIRPNLLQSISMKGCQKATEINLAVLNEVLIRLAKLTGIDKALQQYIK